MALDPGAQAAKKKAEEDEKKREKARQMQEDRADREAERHEISVSPQVEREPAAITQARNDAQVKAQRGYDPRFDDPDYGKEDKKDKKDEPSQVQDTWRPPREDDPYASTFNQNRPDQSLYDGQEPWNPFSAAGNAVSGAVSGYFNRWNSANEDVNIYNVTPPESAPDWYKSAFPAQPERDANAEVGLNTPNKAWDYYQSGRQDRQENTWDTPEKNPFQAYQSAPTLTEAATGQPTTDIVGRTLGAPVDSLPKIGAAVGNAAQWLRTPFQENFPATTEAVSDTITDAFNLFSVPADALESAVPTGQGFSVGELVSTAGEALVNIDETTDFGNIGQQWKENFDKGLKEREAIRGEWDNMTPEQRDAAGWSLMGGYSGVDAQAKIYDGVLNQDANVEKLELAAKELYAAGDAEGAAAAGRAAEELKNKTPTDFVDDNYKIGPELVASMVLDPLNLIDAFAAVAKLGPVARRVAKATEEILGADEVLIAKNMDELAKAAESVFVPSGGQRNWFDVWNGLWGKTDEARAATDQHQSWKLVSSLFNNIEDKGQARQLYDAVVNNPTSLPDALTAANRGTKQLADQKAIDALKTLLPGMSANPVDSFKSLTGAGAFDPAAFSREFYEVAGKLADEFYGVGQVFGEDTAANKLFMGMKSVPDFMRAFMSEQFLNLTPRQLVRNGTSAIGHMFTDGQVTFQPMDKITDFMRLKLGEGLGTARVSEAYGALAGDVGQIGAGGYYGGSSKLHEVASKIPGYGDLLFDEVGNPRWAGSGAFGEQNFYARAFYSRFRNVLTDKWTNSVISTLPGQLQSLGVDENTARMIANKVVDGGIQGNAKTFIDDVTNALTGNGSLFSLAETGVTDDVFSGVDSYRNLRGVFDDYSKGAVDLDTAKAQIADIFDVEKTANADIMSEAGGVAPSRKYFSATDDARDVAETARAAQHGARKTGAANKAKEFTAAAQGELDQFYQGFVGALRGAGEMTSGTIGVFTDAWRDVQNLREKTRIVQGKAFEKWLDGPGDPKSWAEYEAAVSAAYKNMFDAQRGIVSELPLTLADARAGKYTSKYDNALDMMERATEIDPAQAADALVSGTTAESIQAQRQLVDYYAADTYAAAQKHGTTIDAVDVLMSAEADVETAALAAVSDTRALRTQAYASKDWNTYDEEVRKVWTEWVAGTRERYAAAKNDILRAAGSTAQPRAAAPATAAQAATTATGQVPTNPLDELRRVASQSGIATSSGDTHLVRAINKDLGTSFANVGEMSPEELARATDAMKTRAAKATTAALPDDMEDIMAATGTYYTVDGDGNVQTVYDANTKARGGNGNATPPTVADAAHYKYRKLDEVQSTVMQALEATPVNQAAMNRQLAAQVVQAVQGMAPMFDDITAAARNAAQAGADYSMLNYNSRRGFDTMLGAVVPYHYWYTRSAKNWLERIAAHPGMMSAYLDTGDAATAYRDENNVPQRYEGMVPVPGTDNKYWIQNPLDYFIPIREMYETNSFADPESAKSTTGKMIEGASFFGLGTFPLVDAAVKIQEGRASEIDWGNMAYPYPVVNDIYKSVTGNELIPQFAREYGPYTEGRAAGELGVAGKYSPDTIQYAQQMIANRENGADPFLNIPEQEREQAQAAYDETMLRQGRQSATRSVSSFMGPRAAYLAPEELLATQQGREYGQSGYGQENRSGSQAAKDAILERYPYLPSWWAKNDLMPGNIESANPGISAQTNQYWDEYIKISEAETAAVGEFLLANPAATSKEVQAIREQFAAQKDAAKAKYPAVEEYESRRDRRTNAMNPFEEASQIVEDILRYQPPGKPTYPEVDDKALLNKYYEERALWEEKKLDHKERVLEQMALDDTGAADNAQSIVYQIVTGHYAADLMRAFDLRYASGPEIYYQEANDLQNEVDSEKFKQIEAEKEARYQAVASEMGQEVADLWLQYHNTPKGEARSAFKAEHKELYEALDVSYNPERRQQAKELFGEDIYEAAAAYPGSKKNNPEAWNAWKEAVGQEGIDRVYQYFGWQSDLREVESGTVAQEAWPMAPDWMSVEDQIARPYGSDREPINGVSRDEYEQVMQVNPYIGYPDRMPPGGLNQMPETGDPYMIPGYNPVPGYNALPAAVPSELPALQESIASGELTPEIQAAMRQGAYDNGPGGNDPYAGTGSASDVASGGGWGGGGGGGGWGGGGGSYSPSSYPPQVKDMVLQLLQWRLDNWRPYYNDQAVSRAIDKVGPRGR